MKKLSLGFILMLLVASFVSCKKTEYITIAPEPEPTDTSTYTIMMYGCGGENLDPAMVLNIQEALLAGATDRVNFTGQIKFSAAYQKEEVLSGTQRFIVGEPGEKWFEPVEVLDTNLALYDPQTLTDFINWSKEQRPADNYILLLWNHGGAWLPDDDYYNQDSRAIVYDDVLGKKGLSLSNLVKGIKDSGTKFKMIYFDACLMGMVEVLAGVRDCADYSMGASHITPGMGGDYNSLIYHLDKSTNFEQAMTAYVSETIAHWELDNSALDLMVVDNSKMDLLLNEIKVLGGYLKEAATVYNDYLAGKYGQLDFDAQLLCETYATAINNCYHYDDSYFQNGIAAYPFYDIQTLVEILAHGVGGTHSYSAKFVDISSRINRAFSETIVTKQLTSVLAGANLGMGVTIVNNTVWDAYQYQEAYDTLVFQQETGWGDWLKINPVYPIGNPDPSKIAQSGEGEDEGEEDEDEEGGEMTDDLWIQYILSLIGKD